MFTDGNHQADKNKYHCRIIKAFYGISSARNHKGKGENIANQLRCCQNHLA